MEHIAIVNKKWRVIEKILDGRKKIESRWYMARFAPWNRIEKNELIYFKNSGGNVEALAKVDKVIQFANLTPNLVKKILDDFGGEGKINIGSWQESFGLYKSKKYCIMIFLKEARKTKPFKIDKTGFGNGCAWISVEDAMKIKSE